MTKVISISDDAYFELQKIKTRDESFTKVILRLTSLGKGKSITDFCGAWPGTKSELDKIQKELEAGRKSFKSRDFRFNWLKERKKAARRTHVLPRYESLRWLVKFLGKDSY